MQDLPLGRLQLLNTCSQSLLMQKENVRPGSTRQRGFRSLMVQLVLDEARYQLVCLFLNFRKQVLRCI